jgi:hypothetical protein
MGIPRLSNRFSFYNPVSKPRSLEGSPAVSVADKVDVAADLRHAPKIAEGLSRPSPNSHPVSALPEIARYRRYEREEFVNTDDSLSREPGISRYSLYAISAYQRTENQAERDRIENMLGFDLYV